MNGAEVGGGTMMEKQSLVDVEFIWNVWEVHVMILASLFLQVFLFLFAGMRKRCSLMQYVLWPAYLLADSVAIFVLGHLAIRASKSGHHLMYFWAPFVLVHLGGQDTITALSKQDNELWMRHLLVLVTQTAMVGYVVSRASWPDRQLKAAMVIIFVSGCIKYTERTLCLFIASPDSLKILNFLSAKGFSIFPCLGRKHTQISKEATREGTLDMVLEGRPIFWTDREFKFDARASIRVPDLDVFSDILSVDPPINRVQGFPVSSNTNSHRAYEYVGAWLLHCYRCLYTKFGLRVVVINACWDFLRNLPNIVVFPIIIIASLPYGCLMLLYALFHYLSAPIALVLFWTAEKEQTHTARASKADITVTYILLVGALTLDACSTILFLLEYSSIMPGKAGRCRRASLCVANNMKLDCCRKEWSQKIYQYNMFVNSPISPVMSLNKLHTMIIGALYKGHSTIYIPKDGKPVQEFILDNLLSFGTRKEWNIASSRGMLAIKKWMDNHQDPDNARTTEKALKDSISCDFPISVLIWHIATDMCYYVGDKTSTDPEELDKDKQISRQVSNYIMYLIFKCGAIHTVNYHIVFRNTCDEIIDCLFDYPMTRESMHRVKEKMKRPQDSVRKLFDSMRKMIELQTIEEPMKKQEDSVVIEIKTVEEPVKDQEDSMVNPIQKHKEAANDKDDAAGRHVQVQRTQAVHSSVVPRAYQLAQVLMSINDETDRWRLIVEVWAEMLYYIAPRCGASFHYEHLSTGGEFITHVLFLMYFLGPFMPTPGAGAS